MCAKDLYAFTVYANGINILRHLASSLLSLQTSCAMGRTRVKTKKATASSTDVKETPSVEALLSKAQTLVTQCDYELAQKFTLRILERVPNHIDAKELLGVIQLERGDLDEAKQVRAHRIFAAKNFYLTS